MQNICTTWLKLTHTKYSEIKVNLQASKVKYLSDVASITCMFSSLFCLDLLLN